MNSVNFSTQEMVDKRAFKKLIVRFNRTGKIRKKKYVAKIALTEENEMKVLLSIVEDPHTSVRNISQQQDIKSWHRTKNP